MGDVELAGQWASPGPTRDPMGVLVETRYFYFLRAAVWHLLYGTCCMARKKKKKWRRGDVGLGSWRASGIAPGSAHWSYGGDPPLDFFLFSSHTAGAIQQMFLGAVGQGRGRGSIIEKEPAKNMNLILEHKSQP
jgi:hypothetical protein